MSANSDVFTGHARQIAGISAIVLGRLLHSAEWQWRGVDTWRSGRELEMRGRVKRALIQAIDQAG